jgi:hypothetical protein
MEVKSPLAVDDVSGTPSPPASGQTTIYTESGRPYAIGADSVVTYPVPGAILSGAGAPSGAPTGHLPIYRDTSGNAMYFWDGSAWQGPYS